METTDAIPDKKKRAALIRYWFDLADITGAEIARRLDITRAVVNREIDGGHRSRRVRDAVADALDKPYSEVWGEK